MTKEGAKTLKEQNHWLIGSFILWSCLLYAVVLAAPRGVWPELQSAFARLSAKDGVFAAFSPLLAIMVTGLVSSQGKARLIFWRWRNSLPGHRAFSRLALRDARIDPSKLRALVRPWPQGPAEENRTWFALYKKFAEAPTVLQAHRAFLLARDLATIALIFALFGPVGLLLSNVDARGRFLYALVMFLHYIAFMIVGRNHANRFVCNVLVESISEKS
jgi:hypothetical protein